MLLPAKVICEGYKDIHGYFLRSVKHRSLLMTYNLSSSLSGMVACHLTYLSPVRMWHCRHLNVFTIYPLELVAQDLREPNESCEHLLSHAWQNGRQQHCQAFFARNYAVPQGLVSSLCRVAEKKISPIAQWGNVTPQGLRKTNNYKKSKGKRKYRESIRI